MCGPAGLLACGLVGRPARQGSPGAAAVPIQCLSKRGGHCAGARGDLGKQEGLGGGRGAALMRERAALAATVHNKPMAAR